MLSLRDKLAQGLFGSDDKIVKNYTITDDGYCDYNDFIELDKPYIEKNKSKALRMESSTRARKHRKTIREINRDNLSGHC